MPEKNKRGIIAAELSKEGLDAGLTVAYTVDSGSMAPLLVVGDILYIQKAGVGSISPGDLVLLSTDDQLLVHRFHAAVSQDFGPGLVTKGDRSPRADPVWPLQMLSGRVVAVRRGEKKWDMDAGLGKTAHYFFSHLVLFEWRFCKSLPVLKIRLFLLRIFQIQIILLAKLFWLTR